MYHAMQQQHQQQQQIQKLRGLIAVPVSPPMPMHHALQHQQKPIVYLTGKFQIANGITRAPVQQQYMPVKTTMEPHVMGQGQGFSNIKVSFLWYRAKKTHSIKLFFVTISSQHIYNNNNHNQEL